MLLLIAHRSFAHTLARETMVAEEIHEPAADAYDVGGTRPEFQVELALEHNVEVGVLASVFFIKAAHVDKAV